MAFGVVHDDGRPARGGQAGRAARPSHGPATPSTPSRRSPGPRYPARKVDPAPPARPRDLGAPRLRLRAAASRRRSRRPSPSGSVEKAYLALVLGSPGRTIAFAGGRAARRSPATSGVKVRMHVSERRPASRHRPSRSWASARAADGAPVALLACRPRTGRQHQIRAHLHHAGAAPRRATRSTGQTR
jgi:23S rRNA pseudouridine1911/1915/1917 synthase